MRERTPSADDTPKRAPPAPPGEADVACRKATGVASPAVLGACPSAASASAGAAAKCSSSRSIMVASSHGPDELVGVSHFSSQQQQQQQQQLSKQPTPLAGKSAQDKRSRLSNVIDNLRTKRVAPPTAAADTAMTVLNGMCDSSADAAAELSSDNSQPEEPPAKVVVASDQHKPEAAAVDTSKEPQHSAELAKPEAALVREDEVGEPRPESSGSSPMRTLGDIILERLNHDAPVVVDDSKALHQACSELVAHLVDEVVASVEEAVVVPSSEPQQQRQPPEGLCCSVPLDKVASVLQQQQTTTTTCRQQEHKQTTTTTAQPQEQKQTTSTRQLCLYCDRKFPSIPLRQKHVERVHQASPSVGRRSERNQPKQCNGSSTAQQQQSCQYCERPEGGLDGLFRHMVGSHSDRYHGCLACRTRYLTRDALATHLLAEHVNDSKPKEPDIPDLLDSGGGGVNLFSGNAKDVKAAKCSEAASNSSGSNAVMPSDISLTAATPVYKDDGALKQESEESSELAGKPGRAGIRAHPRRVSFEKYNFPRKYDGKEQWSCSIKDLSRFDISTQLSLRRKQQQRHELLGDEGCTRLTEEEQLTPLVEEAAKPPEEESASGVVSLSDSGAVVSGDECRVADCGHGAGAGEQTLEGAQCEATEQPEPVVEAKVKAESTVFSGEFESFMRLTKWNEGGNRHRKLELVYAELTGEWSRPRIYICAACADKYVTLKELEEHKQSAHPNVWCVHFEFSGEQRELHKHLVFLPSPSNVSTVEIPNSSSVKTRQQILNSQPPEKVCTKCSKLCVSLSELHRHMLECGGDQTWLLGLFGASNGKKKCKWRPFGSRRRRQRGMKRNIHKSQTPRNNCAPPRERPSYSGPRVRPSDRESIQKMLANLPAKRATRKVLQENAARSQSRLRNVQSRAADSQASRLVASKAALRNKLLKNAKSYQRKKNLLQEKREQQQQQQQQADEDEAAASAAAPSEPAQLRPRKLLRVLASRVNISSSSSSPRSKAQQSRKLRSSGLPSTSPPPQDLLTQQQDSSTGKQVERRVKVAKKIEQLKSKIGSKSVALASLDSKSLRIGGAQLLTRSKLRAAAKLAWREHERISRRVTRLRSLEDPHDSQTQQTTEEHQQQSDSRPRRSKRDEEQPKPGKIASRSSSQSLDGAKRKSLEARLPLVLVSPADLKQGLARTRPKRDQQAKEPQQTKPVDACSRETSSERRTSRRLSLVASSDDSPRKDAKTQPLRKSTRNKELGDAEAQELTSPEVTPVKDESSGKRRSSLRRQAVEVGDETEDQCSSSTTTSDKSSPVEALQHESSNSNLDSGKENYSGETVTFQQTQTKARLARPRKTRHQSSKASAKRSLSSVIGILTEGVNVPVVETAIVLTVLTSHDAEQQGNPACHGPVASSSSQQPSGSASQEQQQQPPPEASTTTTTTTTESKPEESQACSSSAEEQPANDIIRDLARRKPKGKGSFLEKIVSKIAKSKDVSLEGGDGGCCSLLDVVARSSANPVTATETSGSLGDSSVARVALLEPTIATQQTTSSGVQRTEQLSNSDGGVVPNGSMEAIEPGQTEEQKTEQEPTRPSRDSSPRKNRRKPVSRANVTDDRVGAVEPKDAREDESSVAKDESVTNADETLETSTNEASHEVTLPAKSETRRKGTARSLRRRGGPTEALSEAVESTTDDVPSEVDNSEVMDLSTHRPTGVSVEDAVVGPSDISTESVLPAETTDVAKSTESVEVDETEAPVASGMSVSSVDVPVVQATIVDMPVTESVAQTSKSSRRKKKSAKESVKDDQNCTNESVVEGEIGVAVTPIVDESIEKIGVEEVTLINTVTGNQNEELPVPDSAQNSCTKESTPLEKSSKRKKKISKRSNKSSQKVEEENRLQAASSAAPMENAETTSVSDKTQAVDESVVTVTQSERVMGESVSDQVATVEESVTVVNGVLPESRSNDQNNESTSIDIAQSTLPENTSRKAKTSKSRSKTSKKSARGAKNTPKNTRPEDESATISVENSEATASNEIEDKPTLSGLDAVIAAVSSSEMNSLESNQEITIPEVSSSEIESLETNDLVANVDDVQNSSSVKTSKARKPPKRKLRASEKVPAVVNESELITDLQDQSADLTTQSLRVTEGNVPEEPVTNSMDGSINADVISSDIASCDESGKLLTPDSVESSAPGKRNKTSESSKRKPKTSKRDSKVVDDSGAEQNLHDENSLVPTQDPEISHEIQSSLDHGAATEETDNLHTSTPINNRASKRKTKGSNKKVRIVENSETSADLSNVNASSALATETDMINRVDIQDSEVALEKEGAVESTRSIPEDTLPEAVLLNQEETVENTDELSSSTPARKGKAPKRKAKGNTKKVRIVENFESSADLSNIETSLPAPVIEHAILDSSKTQGTPVEQEDKREGENSDILPQNIVTENRLIGQDERTDEKISTNVRNNKASSKRKTKANSKRVRINENLASQTEISSIDMTTSTSATADGTIAEVLPSFVTESVASEPNESSNVIELETPAISAKSRKSKQKSKSSKSCNETDRESKQVDHLENGSKVDSILSTEMVTEDATETPEKTNESAILATADDSLVQEASQSVPESGMFILNESSNATEMEETPATPAKGKKSSKQKRKLSKSRSKSARESKEVDRLEEETKVDSTLVTGIVTDDATEVSEKINQSATIASPDETIVEEAPSMQDTVTSQPTEILNVTEMRIPAVPAKSKKSSKQKRKLSKSRTKSDRDPKEVGHLEEGTRVDSKVSTETEPEDAAEMSETISESGTLTTGDEMLVDAVPSSVLEPVLSDSTKVTTVTGMETPAIPAKSKKSSKQKRKASKSRKKSDRESKEIDDDSEQTEGDSIVSIGMATDDATESSEKVNEAVPVSAQEIATASNESVQADPSVDPKSLELDHTNVGRGNDKVSERSKRASKRNSEVLADLETSDDHVSDVPEESFKIPESIETTKSARRRVTKKKSRAVDDSASEDLEKIEVETEKSVADEVSASLADSTDEDISTLESETSSRRSSRRSSRTIRNAESAIVKESDDSDVSSANEMDSSRPRRSQRSKNVAPDNSRDSSVSSIDANVSSTEGKPEKKQLPSRKAKKNASLVDDHLELPSGTGTPNELTEEKSQDSAENAQIKDIAQTDFRNSSESKDNETQDSNPEFQSQIESEETEEMEKYDDKHPKTPESQLSSLDENTEVDEGQQPGQKSLACEADESNNLDLQAPKKRLGGNFAIVTKSGKILIVEKKKKLTKEVARFFCEVCNTSFTRKSSLKKHNLSQSHILQATMSGDKEVAKEIQELVDASSQSKKHHISKDSDLEEESEETQVQEKDEETAASDEQIEEQVEAPSAKAMECEAPIIESSVPTIEDNEPTPVAEEPLVEPVETSIDLSMPKLPEPIVASPLIIPEPLFSHKSPEDALEDEMLDEEICKITENMSHDEYVLTDHVSPVTPEAASTPIKELKAPEKLPSKLVAKQKKKKKEKEKKKRNLADEHLSLDTPAPAVVEPPPPVPENQNSSDVSLEDSELNAEVAMITNTLEVEQAATPTASSGKREPRSKKTIVESADEPRRTARTRVQNVAQTLSTSEGKENSRPRRNQLRPSYKEDENTDLESPMPRQRVEAESDAVFVEPRELSRSRRDRSNVTVTESETSDVEKPASTKKPKSKKKQSKKRPGTAESDEAMIPDDELLKKIDSGIVADLPTEHSNPEESSATEGEDKAEEPQSVAGSKKKRSRKTKSVVEKPEAEQVPVVPSEDLPMEQTEPAPVAEEEPEALVTEEKLSSNSNRKQSSSKKSQNKRRKKKTAQEESPDTAAKSDEAALPLETSTKEISTPDKLDAGQSLVQVGETSLEQHDEISIPSIAVIETTHGQDTNEQLRQQWVESRSEPARLDPGFDSDDNSLDTDNMSVDIQKLLDDPEMTSELAQQVDEDSQEAGNIDVLNIEKPLPIDTPDTKQPEQSELKSSNSRRKASTSKKSSKSRRQAKKSESSADVLDSEMKHDVEQRKDDVQSTQEEPNEIDAGELSDAEQSTLVARSLRNRSANSTRRSEANSSGSGRSRQSKRRAEELISRAFHDDSPLLANESRRSSQRQSRKSQQLKPSEDADPPAEPPMTDEEVEQEPLPFRQGPSSEPDDNSCSEDEEPLPEYGRTSSPSSDDLLDDDVDLGRNRNRNPRTVSKSEEELTIETATEPEEEDDEDEDNGIEFERPRLEQQQQQQQQQTTKVLNFDEELFVECCSRLKASSDNELRGAKKIKLDHSATIDHVSGGQYRHHQQFHRREEVLGGYRTKDRWRDVESQNSLGSLLESVNQLLGEEHNSNEKDYQMHGSSKRRSHHHHHHHHHHKHHKRARANRSASPDELLSDGDDEAEDNLGYDDSLDVAFEHNNKLRDKIQQRMRESESLIATSFAKSSPTVESTTYQAYPDYETPFKQQQHHKHKTNNGMSGMLDKALSTLLVNNEKRDHNGSAPMKLLAELACARAPTSTTPTVPQPSPKNSIEAVKGVDLSSDERKNSPSESEQSSHKKAKNPIKELFERKKEVQEKRQVDKIKINLSKSASNESKTKKQKSKSKSAQHNLPLIRTSQFRGGMAERKKRRDDCKKKQQQSDKATKSSTGPKDVYDFDEEESPGEIDLPPVLSFRAKTNDTSREFSMSALLSKTIGDTLTNGKSISAIGENLESMVDRKFKDIEKLASKSDDQAASADGPMDEFVERKPKSKRSSNEHSKHSNKLKKKSNKNVKKKSRNAWYENDSSDEFVTKLRDDDLQGVGLSKSQRTCSKGKQNLFAEMSSTSSESEFENTLDSEMSSRVEMDQAVVENPTEEIESKDDGKGAETRQRSISPEPKAVEHGGESRSSRCNGASSTSETENKKSAESEELSDQPLVIDESLKEPADQGTNSDAETEDRPYVLDDLYREDSSIVDSDRAGEESTLEDKAAAPEDPSSQPTEAQPPPARKPSKKSEAKKRRPPSKSGAKKKPQRATSLPEKLPSNAKPENESENLPLHVFLSRKVQQSKKRKQQQELAKLIEEQRRLLAGDDQPTRRQRKCAIGKQGLLAEFSSSDDEDGPRNRHHQQRRRVAEGADDKRDADVDEVPPSGGPEVAQPTASEAPTSTSRPNKPRQRESKERRRERYIEKKHEQMIAKEQRAIEEAIMRELEEKRLGAGPELDQPAQDTKDKPAKKGGGAKKKPEAAKRKSSSSRSPQKAKKPHRAAAADQQQMKDESAASNGVADDDEELKMGRSWNRLDEDVGVAIGRRKRAAANQLYYWSSSSDDDDRQTKSKASRPKQRVSSQDSTTGLTATPSSSAAPGQTEAVAGDEAQEGDRPEQHGWIVGDSHKRMITMLAMEKQMKEKRRRSENDEQAPQVANGGTPTPPTVKDKSAGKKHRNSTS